jgi:hypothetical protein
MSLKGKKREEAGKSQLGEEENSAKKVREKATCHHTPKTKKAIQYLQRKNAENLKALTPPLPSKERRSSSKRGRDDAENIR